MEGNLLTRGFTNAHLKGMQLNQLKFIDVRYIVPGLAEPGAPPVALQLVTVHATHFFFFLIHVLQSSN